MLKNLDKMSPESIRELLLLNTYKVAVLRAQVDTLSDILVKKKLITREQLWKLTNEQFEQ
ncbi:MAG: hypothetical protein ABIA93_07740 [Candidatus Woesearchaeota archaeon]